MLPRERERLEGQLIRWGYTLRMLEHMQPWTLLSHYASEKKKRGIKDEQILASKEFNTVDKENTVESKYNGASIPYRLKK